MQELTLEQLFDRFRREGDAQAFEKIYDRCVPELFRVAGYLCRDASSAEDLLQLTLLTAIQKAGDFDVNRKLMPWLLGILAHKGREMVRKDARSPNPSRLDLAHEAPSTHEIAAFRELDRKVLEAIDSLPDPYRSVLVMRIKIQLSGAEIAQALGITPATVRSQIQRGRKLLEERLPKSLRSGALAALFFAETARGGVAMKSAAMKSAVMQAAHSYISAQGFAVAVAASAATTSHAGALAGIGAIMTKKTLLLALVIVLSGLGTWALWDDPARDESLVEPGNQSVSSEGELAPRAPLGDRRRESGGRELVPSTGDASGSLLVRVHRTERREAGPGMLVVLTRMADVYAVLGKSRTVATLANGHARYEKLQPGRYRVHTYRGGSRQEVDVRVKEEAVVDLTIPEGIHIKGRVVDAGERPIEGARIWLSSSSYIPDDGRWVTKSGRDGRFELPDVEPGRFVAAMQAGLLKSRAVKTGGKPGADQVVVIQLSHVAVRLEGTVYDWRGCELEHARIQIGFGPWRRQLPTRLFGKKPDMPFGFNQFAIEVESGRGGRFRCDSVAPAKDLPLWVRAPGHSLLFKKVDLRLGKSTKVEIRLQRAARLEGRVLDSEGKPCRGVSIRIERSQHQGPRWQSEYTVSDGEGHFRMDEVRTGRLQVTADGKSRGRAVATLEFLPGQRTEWIARIASGGTIRGRLVGQDGSSLEGLRVEPQLAEWMPKGKQQWYAKAAVADAQGRFVIRRCENARYSLRVYRGGISFPVQVLDDVRPGQREILVNVHTPKFGSIQGRLRHEDGSKVESATARVTDSHRSVDVAVDPGSGAFELRDLPGGRYELWILVDGKRRVRLDDIRLDSGQNLDVGLLKVQDFAALAGAILCTNGELPKYVGPTLRNAKGMTLGPIFAVKGRYQSGFWIPPGKWTATIWTDRILSVSKRLELLPGQKLQLDWVVQRASTRVVILELEDPSASKPEGRWARSIYVQSSWKASVLRKPLHRPIEWAAGETSKKLELALLPGTYEVSIQMQSGRQVKGRFQIPQSTSTENPAATPIKVTLR